MISKQQIANLRIVSFPDPVLRKNCAPIESFGPYLTQLAERMCALMHMHQGVGLAGPQVGVPWRIFVWNPTGLPEHDAVCINPEFARLEGREEAEEGCLSIDGVHVQVARAQRAEISTQRPDGSTVRMSAEGLVARIWQHETDHLNGRLILDYMSPADEIACRRALKELEAKYQSAQKQHKAPRRRPARK